MPAYFGIGSLPGTSGTGGQPLVVTGPRSPTRSSGLTGTRLSSNPVASRSAATTAAVDLDDCAFRGERELDMGIALAVLVEGRRLTVMMRDPLDDGLVEEVGELPDAKAVHQDVTVLEREERAPVRLAVHPPHALEQT